MMKNKVLMIAGFVGLAVLIVGGSAYATTVGLNIVLDPTFTGSGSHQSVEADATFNNGLNPSGTYAGAMMGNVMGTIANSQGVLAGVIGKFSGDGSTGVGTAVLGEVGEDAVSPSAAIIAAYGGDTSVVTAPAGFALRSFNSTGGSGFTYGLDLKGETVSGYNAVAISGADIRLNSGATVKSASGVPSGTCAAGSLYLRSDATSSTAAAYVCAPANTWTAI